jgi:hypothetical protein
MGLLFAAVLMFFTTHSALSGDDANDEAAIFGLMIKTWERPDAPLVVDPIVVVDTYAIAGWIQDCAKSAVFGMSYCVVAINLGR